MAKKNFFYVLPLLTLLSVSPAELLEHKPSRSLASVEVEVIEEKEETVEEKKFVRFEAMISQIDPSNLLIVESITKESVIEKADSLQAQIQQEAEKFNKDATDKEEIKLQRESIESLVVDAVIFDKEVKTLDEQEALDEESKEKLLLAGDSHKEQLELLIAELENNEEILDIEPPKLADIEEPKKEEEEEEVEEKKEEAPKVALEDEKAEEKVEEKKEEICAASEQVKVLTTQVEKLMEEQNLILQAMLNLTQVMLNMSQNMQPQQSYFPMPQTAYQYHAPMSQGNWVYHPQGFNPQQGQGFYPGQAYSAPQQQLPQGQFQNNWNLQPSQNFQFNPSSQMPVEVGQFGLAQPQPMTSFNFSSNSMPMLGML